MDELYEHQKLALSRLKNGSILAGDVGSGKSFVAAAYYMQHEAPRDVIVITTAKKRDSFDWEAEFIRYGIGSRVVATTGGALTVDSWNNLHAYRERTDCFFIFDEQRVVGSGEWTKNFLSISASNRWLLLSATPGDSWLDYIPVFVANGFYKNRTEFLREHVVFTRYAKFPKVERYTAVGRLVKLRNDILVPMPFVRSTTRNVEQVLVDHDRAQFERVLKDRWNIYEAKPLRDVAELFSVMRKVVNSSSSRKEKLLSLMSTHPRLIVFYNFDYELMALRTLLAPTPQTGLSEQTTKRSSTESTEPTPIPAGIESSSDSTGLTVFAQAAIVLSPLNGLRKATGTTTKPTTTGSGNPSALASQTEKTEWQTPELVGIKSSTTSPFQAAVRSSSATAAIPMRRPESSSTTSTTKSTTPTFQLAEWNGHKHEPVPTSERWIYLVQYQAGAEGWNCITTDTMVFYSLTYSYKNWHQAFGRIDRLNTPFTKLNYYIFMSNSVIDHAIFKALGEKKSFNERGFLSKIKDTRSQKV